MLFHTVIRPSFWREIDWKNYFKNLKNMKDTMADLDIKDKESST